MGRFGKSRVEISWIHNVRFYASPGETGMTINIYCSMSEPDEMLFMLHYLTSSDVFFDIGANAGSYSLLALGINKCDVYSFEPVLATRQRLIENFELNGFSTNLVQDCALGAQSGEGRMTQSLDATNHVLQSTESGLSDFVRVETLDSYSNVEGVTLLKIDVEGYEMEILRGASSFLKKESLKALIVETNGSTENYGSSDSAIESFLKNLNFEPFHYDIENRALVPLNQVNSIGNTIFVRDLAAVKKRLSEGIEVRIHQSSY
jgi:FkbM family methyltransferase